MISIINVDKRYVALTGDFNSKTGTLNDYIEPDDSILDLFDFDTDLYDYMYDFQNLLNHEIPLKRVSKCKGRTNNYGHKLLEVCKRNNLYIANSRIGSDANIGERTCKDATVVDYLILSSNLFSLITNFEIDEFVPLYSDCHCCLHFDLKAILSIACKDQVTVREKYFNEKFVRWKREKKSEYVNRIHEDPKGTLAMINDKLHELSVDISQNQMNDIISEINFNFTDAAIETFGKIGQRRKWKQDDSKPWFDKNCSKNRKRIHKARKRYSFLKNAENRRKMRLASKEYKASLNRALTEYQ